MTLWQSLGEISGPVLALAAIGCGYTTWRSFELRPVGIAIMLSCLASNAAHYFLTQAERPAAYTVAEALFLSMAFLAHVCGGSRILILGVSVSVLSVCSNLAISTVDHVSRDQINLWEGFTNLCFAAECVLTGIAGIRSRRGSRSDNSAWDGSVALHGGLAAATETQR